jgi:formamidopyrimidine-DNA glycosylase
MPELPEVETMVRGIRPFVEGREIVDVRKCHCRCRPISITPGLAKLSRSVVGKRVTAVRRLGKRAVLDVDDELSLVIEPRMTGLLLLSDPPDQEHLRIEWRFSGRREYNSLWFWDRRGLGTLQLFDRETLARKLGERTLGPDALEMTEAEWRQRFANTRREIKVALLDQKLAAGIGNLYASEILHHARVHPACPAGTLKPPQVRRLHQAVQLVLREAIEHEGSTLSDATYRNALNQHGRYQNAHRVYKRDGEACLSCGKSTIVRIVQAQRSTFFCPRCQG